MGVRLRGACPAGLVQNGPACIDPSQWQGICPPNTIVVGPGGVGPATAAQQEAGQFQCAPYTQDLATSAAAAAFAAYPPQPAPTPIPVSAAQPVSAPAAETPVTVVAATAAPAIPTIPPAALLVALGLVAVWLATRD